LLTGALVLLGLVLVVALGHGAVAIPVERILGLAIEGFSAASQITPRERMIVVEIRLPRVLLGAVVGAALAIAGAALQGLFRNPLADPDLIGVSSAAALGAALAIFFGIGFEAVFGGAQALPILAFASGVLALTLVWRIGGRGPDRVATMLLAGLGIAALARAGLGLLSFLSNDQQLRDITFWMLGSLGGASWTRLTAVLPLLIPATTVLILQARAFDALALGTREAQHLGVDVRRTARVATWAAALCVGAAVAVSGPIGFIGLITPHLARLLVGPGHRRLLPLCGLLGASLLTAADALARTIVMPTELPVGIVTAAIGTPVFIWLLIERRRSQEA
jgi:iron complex transport system permease protein